MTYATVRTDVEVNLRDIDVEDLCEELEDRGFKVIDSGAEGALSVTTQAGEELSTTIGELYYAHVSKSTTFDKLLADFFYKSIGRIV